MMVKIKKILACLLFICLGLFLYTRITYLFREVSCSRDNITGFEKEGNIDVMCIGASTMVEYYQPLTAWHEYGYTSYDYATLYGQIDLYQTYIQRVLETHNPKLFVVDLRMLTTLSDDVYEQGLRFWTDSLPVFSKDRFQSLKEYFNNHSLSETDQITSYYFDIAKYHTNTEVLSNENNWRYLNNEGNARYKGYEPSDVHHFFDKPDIETEKKAELTPMQSEVLYGLLDYCQENQLEVLFVVCPYIIPEEDQLVFNTVRDIVASYGYSFINANEYYDEMGLDFSVDMKNINHVNSVGAEKYTNFLAGYIVQNYTIPIRGDGTETEENFLQWDTDYEYFAEELEQEKKRVYQAVEEKQAALKIAETMKDCDNFTEWSLKAQNEHYTVIVCVNWDEVDERNIEVDDMQSLKVWGISDSLKEHYLYICSGTDIICQINQTVEIESSNWIGVIDGLGQMQCNALIGDEILLEVGDNTFHKPDSGIQFVLVDNDIKEVIDSFELIIDENGSVQMKR